MGPLNLVDAERPTRILVVANRTTATYRLLVEIERRAQASPCEFALLIPDVGKRKIPNWTSVSALPLLRRAAHGRVGSVAAGPHPVASIENAVRYGDFDEIIVSTEPQWLSRWLRRDIVHSVQRLGLPVTAILPGRSTPLSDKEAARTIISAGGPGGL